ncbi:MAG: cell division transport system permease protein [Candidatus Krumholzibacteriia bacterium]|jgi:cell division transport system permease protein
MLNRAQTSYLLRESFAGFHRRKLTTGVTILIMGAALLVLAVLTLITFNMGHMLESARQGIDIRVYLQSQLSDEQMAELQPRLVVIPGVQGVRWISPEDAMAEFKAELGDDAGILNMLDENPLPASFHLALTPGARDLASVQRIRDEVVVWPEVSEVMFNQEWIGALENWTFRFQMASLVAGFIVFLAAVFVISNTVKLTMAASARVIQVQKLVGATNAFIRTPYIAEGMIQGFLAGAFAMGLLAVCGWLFSDSLGGIIFFTTRQIAGFVMFCIALGLIGSWSAMRKYLTMQSEI